MRKICLILLSIFLFMSCNMDSSDYVEEVVDSAVNVKISVVPISSKSLVSSYPSGTAEYYQFRAVPQFGSGNVQGETSNWTDFSNNSTVGYFAPGKWKFEARIICGSKTSYGVIYKGETEVTLSESSKTVSLTLKNVITDGGKGTVSFNINVKAMSSSKGSLKIYSNEMLVTPVSCSSSMSGSTVAFSGSFKSEAGFQNVRFEFWDLSVDSVSYVSSQSLIVRVVENTSVSVVGNLTTSEYVDTNFNVSYKNISATISGPVSVSTGSTKTYTCNASGSSDFHYQWYINGIAYPDATDSRFPRYFSNSGVYSLTCVVWCMDGDVKIYTSASTEITVS